MPVGQSMMFSSSTGAVVNYRLESIENSEPYVSYSQGGHLISSQDPEECLLTSMHTYVSSELDTTLLLDFRTVVPAVDRPLQLFVKIRKTDDAAPKSIGSSFLFTVTRLTPETASEISGLEFYPSKVFGQTEYTDVLEKTNQPGHPVFELEPGYPAEVLLSRMAVSKGTGIVEFEQLDGVVYTRVPP